MRVTKLDSLLAFTAQNTQVIESILMICSISAFINEWYKLKEFSFNDNWLFFKSLIIFSKPNKNMKNDFSKKYIKYQYTVPKTWQNCNRVQHLIFLKVSAINKYSSYFFKKFFLAKVSILKNRIEKHVINLLKNLQEAALPIICNNTPAIVIYGQFQIYYIMGGMLLSSCFYLFPTWSFEKYPSFKLNLTYLTWKMLRNDSARNTQTMKITTKKIINICIQENSIALEI